MPHGVGICRWGTVSASTWRGSPRRGSARPHRRARRADGGGDRGGAIEIQNRRRRRRSGLSERDRAVLEIERAHGSAPEVWPLKVAEAQRQLGLTADGYRLVLRSLIHDPTAAAEAPEIIEPLRRLRDSRLS